MPVLNEETLKWLATDETIDPESETPLASVVFMLYYGLQLKTYLLKASDKLMQTFPTQPEDLGTTSVYLAGSCAQGFYMNTDQLQDARDFDIVTIFKNYVVEEDCCTRDEEGNDFTVIYRRSHSNIAYGHESENSSSQLELENHATSTPNRAALVTPTHSNLVIKIFPDTQLGYVLLEKCDSSGNPYIPPIYVKTSELTKVRKEYWDNLWQKRFEEDEDLPFGAIWTTGPAVTIALRHEVHRQTLPVTSDLVFALQYPGWPKLAEEWLCRKRASGWPSAEIIEKVRLAGCLLVPKGHFGSMHEDYEWRISFSLGEVILSRSVSRVQRELLQICKALITEPQYSKDLVGLGDIPSYFMLHTLFWLSEEIELREWNCCNLATLLFKFLDRLILQVSNKCLPHYFVPSLNLMEKYSGETYISSDGFEMRTDRKFSFILYGLMRVRKDPLGQLLQQRRFLHLPSAFYEDIFRPLVEQITTEGQFDRYHFPVILNRIAEYHLSEGDCDTAKKYAEDAYKLKTVISPTSNVDSSTAQLLNTLVKCYYYSGDVRRAWECSDLLYPFLQWCVKKSEPTVDTELTQKVSESLKLRGKLSLGITHEAQGHTKDTDNTSSDALLLFRNAVKQNKTTKNILELGIIYLHLGKLDKVEELLTCLETQQSPNLNDEEEEILYQRVQAEQNRTTYEQTSPLFKSSHLEDRTGEHPTSLKRNPLQEKLSESLSVLRFRSNDQDVKTQHTSKFLDPFDPDGDKTQPLNKMVIQQCVADDLSDKSSPDEYNDSERKKTQMAILEESKDDESFLSGANNNSSTEIGTCNSLQCEDMPEYDSSEKQVGPSTDTDIPYIEMKHIYLFTISVFFEKLGYEELSRTVINQLKDSTDEPDHYSAKRLKMLGESFRSQKETSRIKSDRPYLPRNEDEHIVFTKSDIPILDDVLKSCFEKEHLHVLKLPLYVVMLHLQMEYKKSMNLGIDCFLLFMKLREELDSRLKHFGSLTNNTFEMEQVVDEYYESLRLVAGHLRSFGDDKSSENILRAIEGREKPCNVHDRAIEFIKTLMKLVPATEVHNPLLNKIFG